MQLSSSIARRKFSVCSLMLAALVFASHSAALAQTTQEGDVEILVREIRASMPDMGSNGFIVPTNAQLTSWANVFTDLKNDNFTTIQSQVSPYGYLFIRYFNIPTAETLYILKEETPIQRGWGTYIYDPLGTNDITIEVPHPRSDTNTTIMGIRAFTRLNAQWYFLAGTHRYANTDSSSDMSHVTQSVFHRGHEVVATSCAIQPHGFDRSNPIYNGYPDVVISNGTLYPQAILYTLQTRYAANGFAVGVVNTSTYPSLWRLAATKNKQGQWSNANGKLFVHIEHDYPLRIDSVLMGRCIAAMYETFTPPNAVQEERPIVFTLEQNFPNPFNPTTTIRFSIGDLGGHERSNLVLLQVFDVLGREVATLVGGQLMPGIYSTIWNATAYPSGTYYYRLNITDLIEPAGRSRSMTKKMLLVR